jgi:hypothetical protein
MATSALQRAAIRAGRLASSPMETFRLKGYSQSKVMANGDVSWEDLIAEQGRAQGSRHLTGMHISCDDLSLLLLDGKTPETQILEHTTAPLACLLVNGMEVLAEVVFAVAWN